MSKSLLHDAFDHHIWATDRLIESCRELTPEQLATVAPGTYGSIMSTLRHMVASDRWYLSFFPAGAVLPQIDDEDAPGLDELVSAMQADQAAWRELLAGALDPDADIVETDEGWEIHSPMGIRLAQVLHHGTDHRSQVCTVLSVLGRTPPDIDVWAYARASGRERATRLP